MKKLLAFTILFFAFNHSIAGSISINFISPQLNQVYGNSLPIEVSVVSTFQVNSVVADVNGHLATLIYDIGSGHFSGNLLLTGLPEGISYPLTVTVTDIFNTQQQASVNFIYANPPGIDFIYPLSWSNAYPLLPLKVICTGIDTSTLRIKIDFGSQHVFDMNFSNTIDTVLQLSPAASSFGVMYITATDKWGQVSSTSRTILYDNNIFLSPKYTGTDKIFDFNYGKALEVNAQYQGRIVDISTANTEQVGNGLYHRIDNESLTYLTPYGVIYGQNQNEHPYDWNNGVLYSIAGKKSVRASGQYATFEKISGPNQSDVYLRNLATQSDQLIGTYYEYFEDECVAPNGVVVYRNDQFNLIRYKNGTLTTLTNNAGFTLFNEFPLTDGNYVVYLKNLAMFNEYSIYLHNGISEILLSDLGAYTPGESPQAGVNYQVNNKFVAYSKPGNSGQLQVWLRDTTGSNAQVTFFNTSSTIEGLAPNGDIVYKNDGIRYYVKKGIIQTPRPLGAALGKLCYRDSSWYVIEGRYIYKLLVKAFVTVANGNWNDPAVWENNIIPPPDADIIILNNIVVNVNTTCNSLQVNPPGSVTVSPGVTLTVLH